MSKCKNGKLLYYTLSIDYSNFHQKHLSNAFVLKKEIIDNNYINEFMTRTTRFVLLNKT